VTALTRRLMRRHVPQARAAAAPDGERWVLASADGTPVAARVFRGPRVERVLVLYSAAACPKLLYAAFAAWLAQRGWAVLSFDYRGIGESASAATLGAGTGLQQWAQDGQAVAAAAVQAWPGLPLVVLGHSIGGMLAGTLPHPAVRGMLTVGSQQCYWRDWSPRWLPVFAALWMLGFPLAARLQGHVPGRWFGMPENVPGGVARQWSLACRSAALPSQALNGAGDDAVAAGAEPQAPATPAGLARFARPVVAYAIADDPIGTPRAVRRLHAHFPQAQLRLHRPGQPLGHFGVFARRGQGLWPEFETTLRQLADAAPPTPGETA
jgi:predicted alpha/beta hydrolase